ncbi:MAG: hypothetical protein FJ399_13260 [Verrucomicrobia bacterium]|nr:hypothetical protein [Verrucomicrobiota bacterium]
MIAARPAAPSPFRRFVAAGSALLVLALTVFAASPTAHAWLHQTDDRCSAAHHAPATPADDDEADCAITLFAAGLVLPLASAAFAPPAPVPAGVPPVAAELFLLPPRYLHQPERGPPSGA